MPVSISPVLYNMQNSIPSRIHFQYSNFPVHSISGQSKCDRFFREYVSRCAAGKGRAVLEGVGLETEAKEMCYKNHSLNEEEAVQTGLIYWRNKKGDTATWTVLLKSMKYAEIAVQKINELEKEILKGAVGQLNFMF